MIGIGPEIDRFRKAIAQRLGLEFDDSKLAFLSEVLGARIVATGSAPFAYLSSLESGRDACEELHALAELLTVNETYFFRNQQQLRAFEEVALPSRVGSRTGDRTLRVLSAGCASGEETYTLAIIARERLAREPQWRLDLKGVDIHGSAIERARAGKYSTWSLRETPAEIRSRWFRQVARTHVLDESIRSLASFEQRNLVQECPELWSPGLYDVVFFRNVVMYFTPEQALAIVARIARALVPGGFLFLGDAETLRGLSNDFTLRHTHGTFYYQRKGPDHPAATEVHQVRNAAPAWRVLPSSTQSDGASWVESIRRSSERIESLTQVSAPWVDEQSAGPRMAPPAESRAALVRPLKLLQEERFHEALELLGSLDSDSRSSSESLLLRATLLVNRGDFASAEQTCRCLLAEDDLSAAAHYLLALCREGVGDVAAAEAQHEVAAYLDAQFAMPRLHLGRLARRRGDKHAARAELSRAHSLLRNEDPARLVLFGGGFDRAALLELCRAELVSCGGAA